MMGGHIGKGQQQGRRNMLVRHGIVALSTGMAVGRICILATGKKPRS
jgi:hypothetical protein